MARTLGSWGVTPNALSVLSLLFAFAAAAAFAWSGPALPWLLLAGSALVLANALADGFDGRLARLQKSENAQGDYLDHVIDRYADFAILAGIALSGWAIDIRIGLFAIIGTALTSYMGTQAQAIGLGRNYRGLLGRADRITILAVAPVVEFIRVTWLPFDVPYLGSVLAVVMLYIAVMGNITAVQRFIHGWRDLEKRGAP